MNKRCIPDKNSIHNSVSERLSQHLFKYLDQDKTSPHCGAWTYKRNLHWLW